MLNFLQATIMPLPKIMAYDLLVNHYIQELNDLRDLSYGKSRKLNTLANGDHLSWTASKTDLIELRYALQASGAIKSGTAGIKEMAADVQNYFDKQQIANFSEVDAQTLDNLLRNHFLEDFRISSTFKNEYLVTQAQETLTGNQFEINAYINTSVGLLINGNATIGVPNIVATNGVLHVIDEVLTLPSVVDFIQADTELASFSTALNLDNQAPEDYIARLNETTTTSEAPFTVFAPNDEAFANVLLELFPEQDASLGGIDTQDLTNILNLHIVINQEYRIEELPNGSISTLGGTLQVSPEQTLIDANGREANFLSTNHQASNGVLHTIDTVLLP